MRLTKLEHQRFLFSVVQNMGSRINIVSALVASFAAVLVVAETNKCPPKYCEEIKVSCLTCNGTMLHLDIPNCGCCPQCIPFRGEGEPCDTEGEISTADKKIVTSRKEPVKVDESGEEENQEKNKNQEKEKTPNICRPELTCLQGTCVVIF
ncbi:uncharacterized protein LOC120349476 isoform X2 [Nilaparvata lugens]|uniref:uncharacterized protein LOC120349476 isoform X2 n=1 Tax=Nilaparvata lugens TaxID=108931 RepID=UPI00193DE3EF|nr:uncharacterized protein LOC120349476 isoform X2 [Nilaparvata lugens]